MNRHVPTVSLIIPTHNRGVALQRTLAALSVQTYPADDMEVVIVADGCTDGTVEMLRNYQAPFTLHVSEQPGQGPGAARNCGARNARGRLLIFLDDDIEAAPALVEAHVHAHRNKPDQVVIGYVPPVIPQGPVDFFRMRLRIWWEDQFQAMRRSDHRYMYSNLLSGNFSLETRLFARVGGFDPTFRCHEDYELGMRLIKAGAVFSFAPGALGYHHDMTDLDRALERKYQEGEADVLMGRRHPELRPVLLMARLEAHSLLPSRVMCAIAFTWPRVGDALAAWARQMLHLLEWMRLHRPWRRLLHGLFAYWYWRGVAKELETRRAVINFLRGCPTSPDESGLEIEIDLREGLEVAERRLDQERPSAVRVRYGQQFIGRIPSQVGAERLRGAHLRPHLATTLARPLLVALMIEGARDGAIETGGPADTSTIETAGVHLSKGSNSGVESA